jgi:hypothetical protein
LIAVAKPGGLGQGADTGSRGSAIAVQTTTK